MRRLGVLGWPVGHSRSPAMHRAAFAALGLDDLSYQLLPVPPEILGETVRGLPASGFIGANVTIPHKEAALELATDPTPRARAIGAANTLIFRDGAIAADNTDAPGLVDAIGRDLKGATAVVLGAGGSGRAAAYALREAGAARVAVWNRTPERAQRLARDLGVEATDTPTQADVLVNCTSAGLDARTSQFKHLPIDADAIGAWPTVVDLVYRPGGTPLVEAARAAGCVAVDGLDILVHQGALSFKAWTGLEPPLDAMREGARGPDQHDGHDPRAPQPPPPGGGSRERGGSSAS